MKLKRLIATFIDLLVPNIIGRIISLVQFRIENKTINYLIAFFIVTFMIVAFVTKDCIFGNRSIGKRIMSLRIYQDNKEVVDKKVLIGRIVNAWYSIPLYPIFILINNQSVGDQLYHTEVK